MDPGRWFQSNLEYGRRIVTSGLKGANSGQREFFTGQAPSSFLTDSAFVALGGTLAGACIGVLCHAAGKRHAKRVESNDLACGAIGAAVGFAAGLTWNNRKLVANVTRRALKSINAVREEHWLENHPINYG